MTKYKSKKIECDGIMFDSKDECKYYELLKQRKKDGIITGFELQPKYELIPKYTKDDVKVRAMSYSPDFRIYHNNGSIELVDIKGFSTQQGDIRRKLFNYLYSEKLTWLSRNGKYSDESGFVEYDLLKKLRKDNK